MIDVGLGLYLDRDSTENARKTPYTALIDTGAKRTSVDECLAKDLGFTVKRMEPVATSAGRDVAPIYDTAKIFVPSLDLLLPLNLVGAKLRPDHNCDVLLGRDILANYQMIYDGRTGRVTLSDETTRYTHTKRVGVGLLEKVKEFGRFLGG